MANEDNENKVYQSILLIILWIFIAVLICILYSMWSISNRIFDPAIVHPASL